MSKLNLNCQYSIILLLVFCYWLVQRVWEKIYYVKNHLSEMLFLLMLVDRLKWRQEASQARIDYFKIEINVV